MNISRISNDKIKIFLDPVDLNKLGINFNTFQDDKETAEIFLGNLLTVIDEFGLFHSQNKNIIVDVIESSSGNMTICFENETTKNEIKFTEVCYRFSNTDELIIFCKNIYEKFKSKIEKSELFFQNESYALILKLKYSKSTILSKNELNKGDLNTIAINKTREHGHLLTNTPFEKIISL